jgi:hypothetical protein
MVSFIYDNPFDDCGLSRFESILLEIGIDKDIAGTTRAFYLDTKVVSSGATYRAAGAAFMDY